MASDFHLSKIFLRMSDPCDDSHTLKFKFYEMELELKETA